MPRTSWPGTVCWTMTMRIATPLRASRPTDRFVVGALVGRCTELRCSSNRVRAMPAPSSAERSVERHEPLFDDLHRSLVEQRGVVEAPQPGAECGVVRPG